jgi:glucose/arabinose dehydrogenase
MSLSLLRSMLLSILLAAPAVAQPAFETLRLETVATGLPGSPVAITHAGDERLFITLKEGLIVIWDGERILPEPFLDLRGQVALQFEQGLLSAAFHPDYDTNGVFFVDYTDLAGDTVVARYRVSDDPNRADPDSREVVLFVEQPTVIHNGGQLQFGPDGFLYIGMGDGGSIYDPFCNGQRRDTVLGKILRIDVDAEATEPPFYRIPTGNPFAGPADPPDEVWALGLRNPWRFSFDRLTGDLFIADVGQDTREEVDFQPGGSPGGENYGWKVMEGTLCQSDENCPLPVPPCNDPAFTNPILEYEHGEDGCAVVGGYVYRGNALPGLDGVYLFGDFCTGIVRAAQRVGSGESWEVTDLPLRVPGLTSFGEDVHGEIYLASLGGGLFRLRSVAESGPCTPGPNQLCLVDGRFRVEALWETRDGVSGPGLTRPLTDDTGTFWFFSPDNLEVVVKVIDACAPPFDRFWVFAGGLTNVEVRLSVVDTQALGTGQEAVREYLNPLGTPFAPIQDTEAFATCP